MAWKPPAPLSVKLGKRLEAIDAYAEANGLTRHGAVLRAVDQLLAGPVQDDPFAAAAAAGVVVRPARARAMAKPEFAENRIVEGLRETVHDTKVSVREPSVRRGSGIKLQFGPRRPGPGQLQKR